MQQNELVVKVLKRLASVGILEESLLVGSWCQKYYPKYFQGVEYNPRIRTRDVDIALTDGAHFLESIDLEELLKDEGFEWAFYGDIGVHKLENAELEIEFLIHEAGSPGKRVQKIAGLDINAQKLRNLDILFRAPLLIKEEGFELKIPHPIDYCLQKIIISEKRKNREKAEKDIENALDVIKALKEKGELVSLNEVFDSLPKKSQKTIRKVLEDNDMLSILN